MTEEESRKIVDNIRRVRFHIESNATRKETAFWLQVLQDYADKQQLTAESDTCALEVPNQRFKYKDPLLYTGILNLGRTLNEWTIVAQGKKSNNSMYLENYYAQILSHDVRKILRQPSADWWKSDETQPDRKETTLFWLQVFQHFADEQVSKGNVAKNGEIIRPAKGNDADNSWDDVILGRKNLAVGNTLDHWKQAARGKENGRNEDTKKYYVDLLSNKVKNIFRMKSETWWEARYSRQQKIKALKIRWQRDHTKPNFQWIPPTSAEENGAMYDLGDGKLSQGGFRLGEFITNQMYRFKQGKKSKKDMQELVDAMHLEENPSELQAFWDLCNREIAQPLVTPKDKIKALEERWRRGLFDPPTKKEDKNDPKYDIRDGKGLRGGFNLGAFVSNKISRYKKKTQVESAKQLESVLKRLNRVMEELEQAMHLEGDRLKRFREKYARKELPNSS